MSSMTGPGLGRRTWEDLYRTSLYFITRFATGVKRLTAGPYSIAKSKQGFETCSWTMSDKDGVPVARYVIAKNANGNILALSVKIPAAASKESRARLEAIFRHMVDTAVVK